MEKYKFNDGWMVAETLGWLSDAPQYRAVTLPHDALIDRNADKECSFREASGYLSGGLFEYKKDFLAPPEWKGKKIMVEFDGTLVNTEVVINRNYVKFHPNGYTPYLIDITPYLIYGKSNRLIVRTDGELKSSRWYTGCGLYRDVYIRIGNQTHIEPWSLQVETVKITAESATVKVRAAVVAENYQNLELGYEVYNEVKNKVAEGKCPVHGLKNEIEVDIPEPDCWDSENPHMYQLKCRIYENGESIDEEMTDFGVRQIKWDARKGLLVNGMPVKLRGGCLHHTNGILGAVSVYEIEEEKIKRLKEIGFNAIRTAHNPPSSALLNACDHIGMYVMSEFFDAWRAPKCVHDYHMFFDKWWEEDLTAVVMRDFNHPSVIMWSIGNEITEVDGTSGGFEVAKLLADKTRGLDRTRPVTSGMILLPDLTGAETAEEIEQALSAFYPALPEEGKTKNEALDNVAKNTFCPTFSQERDYWGDTTKPFADTLDIAGYNYMSERYEFDTEKFPNRIIVGAETFPGRIYEYWKLVMRFPNVIGDFCWTAQDYLGEAGLGVNYIGKNWNAKGQYPCRISGSGDLDIIGNRRSQSYYREIVWGKNNIPYIVTKSPELNGAYIGTGMWGWDEVKPSWTYIGHENEKVKVTVYSNADTIKLYLNGHILGESQVLEAKASFWVNYIPGDLVAIAFTKGIETGRNKLKTSGEFYEYKIIKNKIEASDNYLFFSIIATDKAGTPIINCCNQITVKAKNAQIAALANANPFVEKSYVSDSTVLFDGKALLIVRRNNSEHGMVTIGDNDGNYTVCEF